MSTSTHRAAGERVSLTVVLAVLLPLLTVGGLLLVRPASTEVPSPAPPDVRPLTRADVACPAAIPGTGAVRAMTTTDASGRLEVRRAGRAPATRVPVRPGRVGTVRVPEPALVTGRDSVAPGLLGTRAGGSPVAATSCPAPAGEQWFSGLGGQFEHRSVVELVNPDRGTAVADLTVHTARGAVRSPQLRGISVPGGGVRRVDLARVLPRTGLMSAQVVVSRGRLSVAVADELSPVGSGGLRDWIPATAGPSRSSLLMGLVPGAGERTLLVTNPGDDEVRARVEVVTARSTFTPTGAEEVRVAPGSVTAVRLPDVEAQVRRGALGLRVTGTGPLVAGLRQVVDGDLSHLAPAPRFSGRAAAALPGGPARVVLGGASGEASASVVARSADGAVVARRRLSVGPDRAVSWSLPARATSVQVSVSGSPVSGVVALGGRGHAVLPLVAPPVTGEVPAVRPALR
ncbi:hypothetical protein K8W59_12180 [Nocardioides rotundus]|uniref:DUF5719 family protein n=1 Tax=Nocardioides rotundus TaxID=1774216 RepID=UPI001CBF4713|nr:DUF5719 family protein [Nocardioides rotundus]UAL28623.1 hypothetical protein K8W59_12180 [Nocardioides rotundus]